MRRFVHDFLKWFPTAIVGGGLAIAAVWTGAKDWIAVKITWAWFQMSDPWIAFFVLVSIAAYVAAIVWTGKERSPKEKPGVWLFGEGLDHIKVSMLPTSNQSVKFFPQPPRTPPKSLAGAFEAIRQHIHGYPHENLMPRPQPTFQPVKLDDAIRYVANDSAWSALQDQNNPNFSVRVGLALRDALATNRMIAEGRPYHAHRGGIRNPPLHTLEPINASVWKGSHIDAWRAINSPQGLNAIESEAYQGFHDIQLDRADLERIWPRAGPNT